MSTGHRALIASVVLATASLGASRADVVIDWNNVLLDTIRATGGPPCPISRASAMVHAAIYDAVNSIEGTHTPYLTSLEAPAGASEVAAAAGAAHRVLGTLFPARQTIYDAALAASLAAVPNDQHRADGLALGRAVADVLIAVRAHDGTQSEPAYVFGTNPGDYRPTPDDFTSPPFNPGWGGTMPWTMITGDQFRPRGPLGKRRMDHLLHSRGYADQVNEIKSIGARNSTTRTAYQTQTAYFWANDVNGTYKPPGHLNAITQVVSADQQLTLGENARLFCLINIAMGDAGLVAWDAKYRTSIDLWRPVTAIRLADTDDNARTTADPAWLPLNPFTPPFPAYISGHATFAAAWAAAMAGFFGTDAVTFTVDSEDPFYNALPVHGARTYHSFAAAAWENAQSRLYLGVHFRFDAVDGNESGTALGRYVASHMLLPACPADFNGDGSVNGQDVSAFVHALISGDASADFDGDGQVDIEDIRAFIAAYTEGCA